MAVQVEDDKKGKKPKKNESKAGKPKPDSTDDGIVQLVRVSGVVVDGSLSVTKALMKIKGIGPRIAESMIPTLELPPETKVGSLSEQQINEMEQKLEKINDVLPYWMLNRRKDVITGANIHKFGPDLDMQKREDINREKKIKSYRGIRHSLNLPVRGQRTRSSFRKGSTVGVSRKKRG